MQGDRYPFSILGRSNGYLPVHDLRFFELYAVPDSHSRPPQNQEKSPQPIPSPHSINSPIRELFNRFPDFLQFFRLKRLAFHLINFRNSEMPRRTLFNPLAL